MSVNIQILRELNAGVVDEKRFAAYICDIVGTEHYNDDLRELRGTCGFALTGTGAGVQPNTLPAIGTTATAFETRIADGGAVDPNQGGLRALTSGDANFDGGEVNGEELWVVFGLGVEPTFPLAIASSMGSPALAGFLPTESPRPYAVARHLNAVALTLNSNTRGLPLGTPGDWPTSKGGAAGLRNGFSDSGVRSFRPIALKPSTNFSVEARVVDQPQLEPMTITNALTLANFRFSFRAWRMNIRETFGNAQCRNLFS